MIKKTFLLIVCLAMSLFISSEVDATQTISIKGFAYSVEQPDIAHILIKTSGEGTDYNESLKSVNNNIDEIMKLTKEQLGKSITPKVIKTESKAKPAFGLEDYDEYTQDYFTKMAQAMKGKIPSTKEAPKEEKYITTKYIFFSTRDYSVKKLNEFRNTLASQKLAFNEKRSFDFFSTFELNRSYILYGVSDPYKYLGKLAKAAYENARLKAQHMAESIDMNLVELVSIEKGCNNEIEGGIDVSELKKLLGRQVGPASSDPSMLPLKFNSKFTFKIK